MPLVRTMAPVGVPLEPEAETETERLWVEKMVERAGLTVMVGAVTAGPTVMEAVPEAEL